MRIGTWLRVLVSATGPLALAAPNYQSVFGVSPISATVVDAAGNTYVTGNTTSPNFPVTAGAFQKTIIPSVCGYTQGPNGSPGIPIPCPHAFVAKIEPSGTRLVYATYLGGELGDSANAIAVDTAGNVYVTGLTSSARFPVTPGAWQTALGNQASNGFITKLNPEGSGLVFSTYMPGGQPLAIVVDATGEVFATGTVSQHDTFPTTPGAYQTKRPSPIYNDQDVFVLKLNAAGTGLLYATLIAGTFADVPSALAVDAAGNAYVGGYTASTPVYSKPGFVPFPTTPGGLNQPRKDADVFISKLNPTGTALIFSTVFGGSGNDSIYALAVDEEGAVYFGGGDLYSTDFPMTPGAAWTRYGEGFAGKLSSDGSHLVYSTFLSGTASAITVNAAGNAFIVGSTYNSDFPSTPNATMPCLPAAGHGDGSSYSYIVELNAAGTSLLYSGYSRNAIVATMAPGKYYVASDMALFDQMDILAPIEPGIRCIVNAANYRGTAIGPGEIVAIFGQGIGPAQPAGAVIDSSGKVATSINNTRVLVGGIPAPLLYVAQNQINAVIPFGIVGQRLTPVQVERNGTVSLPNFQEPVTNADPAFFTNDASGYGQAAVLNQDGTRNSDRNPAAQGSVISLYVTGIGSMQPAPADGSVPAAPFAKPVLNVTLNIGGVQSDLMYVGDAPGLVEGAVVINARVPPVLQTGAQRLQLIVGDTSSDWYAQNVTVFVR
jgi:uncharacterized protein (TIGR03437 family)